MLSDIPNSVSYIDSCPLFFGRMFIWRSLLKLPENHAAYSSLVDKGTHSAFARIHEEYPIKSRKLLRVLQRLVTCTNYGRCFLCDLAL